MEYLEDDDNFVWTDASNSASSDSDSSMKDNMGGQSGGEESEYDKKYKKQLHNQLFNDDHKSDDGQQYADKKKHKKKRKLEQQTSESETDKPSRRKKIKLEPESDIDKHKHNSHDEHFLDKQVKKEQNFLFPENVKSKKKKKHKSTSETNNCDSMINDTDSDTITQSKLDKDDKESTTNHSHDHQHEQSSNQKKKKTKKSDKQDNCQVDDEVRCAEDCEYSVDKTVNLTDGDPDISEISKISKGNLTYNESFNTNVQHTQTKSRLAEKILFEDDLMDLNSTQTSVNTSRTVVTKLSDKLEKFVKTNTKLKPINIQNSNEFSIDDGDEGWIVKCPSEIEISALRGKALNLESKCKLKLNGQRYEGNADPVKTLTSLIFYENSQVKVNTVVINGFLNLHRKLPKVQPHQDTVMVNNQTDFIPLPDTKCRHPLLGSHYKTAMKLPSRVAERLRTVHRTTEHIHHTPKPEKRKKQTSNYQEQIVSDDMAVDLAIDKKEKKKKRKHSVVEEPALTTHKKKRKNYNLEASDTWESERAIEQSLFDY